MTVATAVTMATANRAARSRRAQLRCAIAHFGSREAMDILGLGPETVDALVSSGLVHSVADLFSLRRKRGPLAGKVIVFTGGLNLMTREEAEDRARACGARRAVSARTRIWSSPVASPDPSGTVPVRWVSGSSTRARSGRWPLVVREDCMENIEIARTFDEVADLLDIQGANPFRVRAYRTAARTIGALDTSVESILKRDGHALEQLPGIGADLAGKIGCLCRTGELPLLKQLTRKTPQSLVTLLRIPGVGPKRGKPIYQKLGVKTLPQLEKAARAGHSRLRGMGPTVEQAILRGIEQEKVQAARGPIADAETYIRPLLAELCTTPGVQRVDVAGSSRRRAETVGDVDILVAATDAAQAAEAFVQYKDVKQVLASGETKCSIVLRSGLQVDLRIVPESSYGGALYYFTRSKAHNIAVRRLALKRRLKISTASSAASVGLPGGPSSTCSPRLACRGFRPSCASTAAKSRRLVRAGSRAWWSLATFAAICRCTRRTPTGRTRWPR